MARGGTTNSARGAGRGSATALTETCFSTLHVLLWLLLSEPKNFAPDS